MEDQSSLVKKLPVLANAIVNLETSGTITTTVSNQTIAVKIHFIYYLLLTEYLTDEKNHHIAKHNSPI